MSIHAYKTALRRLEAPRELERRILAANSAGLDAHRAAYDATEDPQARLEILAYGLGTAANENQAFWRALRRDVSDERNALHPALRAGLISLSLWVDARTTDLLRGRGTVAPLVEVNRIVSAGLGRSEASCEAGSKDIPCP
ncbi:flaF protein [Jannaschia sp. Os4]|uniref:flagellar biosynthesis regulator FlaF n=1 Tax=Jannaschia sp. Os4 TaxID=2807617 RepID=UPI001939BEB3|nr:flaF protein [Jannaschia sp. Os4]